MIESQRTTPSQDTHLADSTFSHLRRNLELHPVARDGKFAIPTFSLEFFESPAVAIAPVIKIESTVPSAQARMFVGVIGIFS